MVDVRVTTDRPAKSDSKHQYRFELVTHDRTWYFSAESVAAMTQWMMLLGALVQTYKPTEEDKAIGGKMADPDAQGQINLRGNTGMRGFSHIYYAVKDGILCLYDGYDGFVAGKHLHRIDCLMVTVKVGASGKKKQRHQFQVVTNVGVVYEFQSDTKDDKEAAIHAIQNAIMWSLSQLESGDITSHEIEETINAKDAMVELQKNRANLACADWSDPLACSYGYQTYAVVRSLAMMRSITSFTLLAWLCH